MPASKAKRKPKPKPKPTGDTPERKLTLKQSLFVEAYLGKAKGNATEAARLAGYKGNDKTLQVVGAENLLKPMIAARLAGRVEEAAISANEVLRLLSDHATGTIEDFLDFPDNERAPTADLRKAQRLGKLHLIKKLEVHEVTGTVKTIWLHDAQSALALLGKYHKLFVDRIEHTGLTEEQAKKMTPQEAYEYAKQNGLI